MRIILAIAVLAMANQAKGETLEAHLAKMKSVIAKDGRCEFAVVAIPKDKSDDHFFPRAAACIGNVTFDQGTMKEKSGCTAFYFNAYELTTMPLVPAYGYNIAEGKKCDAGGFEAALNDLLLKDNTGEKPRNVPVKAAFFYPFKLVGEEMKVLIDGKPTYRQWFDKERTSYVAENDARERTAEAKKEAARKSEQEKEKKVKAKEDANKKKREDLWN